MNISTYKGFGFTEFEAYLVRIYYEWLTQFNKYFKISKHLVVSINENCQMLDK